MNLGDGGLAAAPQGHEVLGIPLHVGVIHHRVPGVGLLLARVVDQLGRGVRQVVAAAEALAGAFHHDHVDVLVGLGPFHCRADVAGRVVGDGVQAFRAVQQQAGDARGARVLFDLQGGKAGHGVLRGAM
ncbi:hypothetical protein D3C78_1103260 [compost metagenome]